MPPKDVERMANSVDPDQTTLFAQTYMSQYLKFLRYLVRVREGCGSKGEG